MSQKHHFFFATTGKFKQTSGHLTFYCYVVGVCDIVCVSLCVAFDPQKRKTTKNQKHIFRNFTTPLFLLTVVLLV